MKPKGSKENRKAVNKSVRAGVIFPVARIYRYLKNRSANKLRISAVAPVYKAAVLEYLTAEVMELAGNMAKDGKRVRITPRDIYLATSLDQEFCKLLQNVTMPSSGILPRMYFTEPKPAIVQYCGAPPNNAPDTVPPPSTPKKKASSAPIKRKKSRKTRFTPKKKLKTSSKLPKKSGGLMVLSEKVLSKGQKLTVMQGNIVDVTADALVHPTNSGLALAGEIGKTLERIGGQTFVEEVKNLRKQGKLDNNAAIMSPGSNFSSKQVIHINSPTWKSPDPIKQLEEAINNILDFAANKKLKSIAVPSIGSGSAGFPKQAAAESILRTMGRYLRERPKSSLKQVYFVLFDEESVNVYIGELERMQE